jgi:DNA-3-methyladenine glycosylase II
MPPRTRTASGILNATTATVKPIVAAKAAKQTATPKKGKADKQTAATPKKRKADSGSEGSDTASDYEAPVSPTKRPKKVQKSATSSSLSKRNASQMSVSGSASVEVNGDTQPAAPAPRVDWNAERPSFLPATLSFSFEEAKRHLINADPRFEDIFNKLSCRPFVKLDRVEPFRCSTTLDYCSQETYCGEP